MLQMYPRIDFPIEKEFNAFTPQEAKEYFEWFISIIPSRLSCLEIDVRTVVDRYVLDYSEESILVLDKWIRQKARSRSVSVEERKDIVQRKKLTGVSAVLTMEMTQLLTEETKFRCFDLGLYLGESLKSNIKNVNWIIEKSKNDMNFNCPILTKTANIPPRFVPMNPLRVAQTIVINTLKLDSKENVLYGYKKWYDGFTVGYRAM